MVGPGVDLIIEDPIAADMTIAGGTYVYDPVNASFGVMEPQVALTITGPTPTLILVEGNANFDVYGTLIIESSASVTFDSCGNTPWGALRLMPAAGSDPSVVQNVTFKNAGAEGSLGAGGTANYQFPEMDNRFPAHVVRMGKAQHMLFDCSFEDMVDGSIAVLTDPNEESLIDGLMFEGGVDPRMACIGYSTFSNDKFLLVDQSDLDLAAVGEVESYYFPQTTVIGASASLTITEDLNVYTGIAAFGTDDATGAFNLDVLGALTIDPPNEVIFDSFDENADAAAWGALRVLSEIPATINNTAFLHGGHPFSRSRSEGGGAPGFVSLEINGETIYGENGLSDLNGQSVGGVNLTVQNPNGFIPGLFSMTGLTDTFKLGGEILWMDNVAASYANPEISNPPPFTADAEDVGMRTEVGDFIVYSGATLTIQSILDPDSNPVEDGYGEIAAEPVKANPNDLEATLEPGLRVVRAAAEFAYNRDINSASLDFFQISQNSPKLPNNVPAHSLRLSSAPHTVNNLRFRFFGGAPILLEGPVVQNIGDLDIPMGSDSPPFRFRAVAVASLDDATSSVISGGTTHLRPNTDFDYYYFPQTTIFRKDAAFIADASTQIGLGPEASLRFLGDTDINGTAVGPVTVFPPIPDTRWGRVELVSSIIAVANNLNLVKGGACVRLPQFRGTGADRVFTRLGGAFAPGAPLLLAGAKHSVSNLTIDDYIDLVMIQDIAAEPKLTGVFNILNASDVAFRAIGVFDLGEGRETLPLVYPKNLKLTAPGVTYNPPDGPLPYLFDRDLIVPSHVDVVYQTGATLDQQLKLMFQKFESITTDPTVSSNLITNKCELVVEGALKTQANKNNPVLFTSTDHVTKKYVPPVEETDMGETDFKSLAYRKKLTSKDLVIKLSDLDSDNKEVKGAGSFPPGSQDWGGIYFLDESDDLNCELKAAEIRNAIFGVTFQTSSGKIVDSLIENSYGSAIICQDRSNPHIEGNTLINNFRGGILCNVNSSPIIVGNNISNNPNATGIHCVQFSSPIVSENQIIGNNVGVIVQSGSTPTLGRVPEGSSEDPGFELDDGRNIISDNFNNGVQFVVNVFNQSPNKIYAENNSWGSDNPIEIDATILDDNEAGLYPFLPANSGMVKFLPLFMEPTPVPTATATSTGPTATKTPGPQVSPTSTKVVIPPIVVTPTPTPTIAPLPAQIVSDRVLSGRVRITQDTVVKSGVTVRFTPGTVVLIEGPYGITVESNARILARGETESKILFLSKDDEYWKGITVQGPDFGNVAARSIFEHCVFQRSGIACLTLTGVKAEVTNSEFLDSFAGIQVMGGVQTNPRIRRNTFTDNYISVLVNLTGVVEGLQPEQYFNLGLGRENPDDNQNNDPGFNSFIQTAGGFPGGRDILVQNFFAQQTLKADENLFLAPDGGAGYDRVDATDLLSSGRVVSVVASATEVSLLPPPILHNIVDNGDGVVTLVDEEIWAGKVVPDATRYTELADGVPLTIKPGTMVGFQPDPSFTARQPSLRFTGRVEALGTKSHPIVFDSLSASPTEFDWGGLEFSSQELTRDVASLMRYIHVGHAETGITFFGGSKTVVTDSVIENCGDTSVLATSEFPGGDDEFLIKGTGGGPFPVSAPLLERVFVLSGSRGQFGLRSLFSSPVLRHCAIGVDPRQNSYEFRPFAVAAIFVKGDKTPDLGTAANPGGNLFFGTANPEKGVYEVLQGTSQSINAIGNYWFENSAKGVKLKIFDFDDSQSAGAVNVVPFLPYPLPINVPGGDLDRDIFYFANDFTAFMQGALGTTPFDDKYNPAADRNDDYVVNDIDLFLFVLENNQKRVVPPREFPDTPTPTSTFTPLFFPTATPTFTVTDTPTTNRTPAPSNTPFPSITIINTPGGTSTPTNTPAGATATPTATMDGGGGTATPTPTPGLVNIELCSALPNPVGADDGAEQVTVHNLETSVQNLNGWYIQDKEGNQFSLSGLIGANQTSTFTISGTAILNNTGGDTLTLFDPQARQVDQDSYAGNPVEGEVVSFSTTCPPSGGSSRLRIFPRSAN
ncbi:MAG: right-handed parallel beta-helix repeat-containing protein, partial [Candidatus Omnitrophica bacterium]|nr:right-handed parallel beta-helix repeat-containing protein [Candidatus Omnitrophota bacterium]